MMKKTPYWWEIAQPLEAEMPTALPSSADVVVIGGGFTGISAGLVAARHGRSVVILDAGIPGRGASTRNGGICSGHIRLSHIQLTRKFGKDYADNIYGEGIEARADLVAFCTDEGIDCQITTAGHFNGAVSQADFDKMAYQADALNAIAGHDVEVIPRHRQHEEIKTDRFYGGLLRREIGGYHPGRFFAGLLAVAKKEGVVIFSNTPAEAVDDAVDGGGATGNPNAKIVTTPKGQIKAGLVIVASTGYTGRRKSFGHFLRRRVIPIQSAIIVTEHLGRDTVKELMPNLRMFGNTAKLSTYFRPTPDEDRIMLGARCFDKLTPETRTINFLNHRLVDILPQLKSAKMEYCWIGNVAFNQRLLPAMFQHDGVFYTAGYQGSGTVWARWLGKKTAEMALGVANKPSIFYDKPPAAVPLYDGNPWFMPFVNGYFMARDQLNEWGHHFKQ
ncbi:MAG: NAD(P)/FAD-dependent oxidoreductase [Candidatus Puniceispirillales bacterium WSBS_2018_MAG_OTU23]